MRNPRRGDREAQYLLNRKVLRRAKVNELDNRGSQFYLAMYWARALAAQDSDAGLAARFGKVAESLAANEQTIVDELLAAQGAAVDLGGYYRPDPDKSATAMRPSKTLNDIIAGV